MRVAAVGWLARDEVEALELASAQAAVSHDHPDAKAAAQAVALAILLGRSGLTRAAIRQRLIEDFGYDLAPERALTRSGFDISAAGTVPPAITAVLEAETWEDAVRTTVCLGGDTDTLACIAGAVAEVVHALPRGIADTARAYLTDDLSAVLERFEAAVRAWTWLLRKLPRATEPKDFGGFLLPNRFTVRRSPFTGGAPELLNSVFCISTFCHTAKQILKNRETYVQI
jgi:ADP-ribosylglycohydrolase